MVTRLACEPFTTAEFMDEYKGCACDWDKMITITREQIIDEVSDLIVSLTRGVVTGRCTYAVRPCNTYGVDCWDSASYTCCDVEGIPLQGVDIAVTEVRINGDVIPASDYFLLDGYKLVRREGSWPAGQDIRKAIGQPNTFSVAYQSGFLPFVARMAATELACVITRWVSGRMAVLPPGVTSASVDGSLITVDPSQVEMQHTPWTNQLLALYGDKSAAVWSPELNDGWVLHTVSA